MSLKWTSVLMIVKDQVFELLSSKTTLMFLILDRNEERPLAEKTLNLLPKYVFTYFITQDYKPVLYAVECWWCSCNLLSYFRLFQCVIHLVCSIYCLLIQVAYLGIGGYWSDWRGRKVSVMHKYFTEFWSIRATEKEEGHKNQNICTWVVFIRSAWSPCIAGSMTRARFFHV